MDFDYDDPHELESDIYSKDSKTPQQVMEYQFEVVHNRNLKEYLKSIEWDGLWLKHETEEEKQIRLELERERQIQIELENHPFNKWF